MADATLLIELAAKSLVVACAALAVLHLTRRRSAAQRSFIGHLALVALIALPLASLLIPAWNPLPLAAEAAAPIARVPQAVTAGALALPAGPATAEPAAAVWSLPSADELLVWGYLAPLAALLLTMLVAVVRLGSMHRRASVLVNPSWQAAMAMAQRRMGFKHGTALLVSEDLRSPVSWGVLRPIILLNQQAVAAVDEAEAIIAHELAHVARLDWAKLLASRVACALFWFNPLVWRLARECHQLREEAADDAVLLSEVDGADYASLLVNAARHDNKALLLAAHGVAPGKDSLKRRITRVLDTDLARGPANMAWSVLCLVALVIVAAPLAAFDPTATPSADAPAEKAGGPVSLAARVAGRAVTSTQVIDTHETLVANDGGKALEQAAGRDRDSDSSRDDDLDTLIASKAVGLTPEYIDAMRAAGFADAKLDELTGARAVGVTPEFARQMRQYDPRVDLGVVTGAKATGLSGAYFGQMRQIFPNLSLDDAVGLNAVGVTPGFAGQMRGMFPRAAADEIQAMAALGVTPEYIRQMRRQGLPASEPDQVIQSRVLFPGKGPRAVHPAPAVPQAAAAAVARSVEMANGIARSVSAVPPLPPAPPGSPGD